VLNLSSKGINDLSDWKELVQTCPHVEELEISDNLISSWSYVGHLAEGWNRLKSLDLRFTFKLVIYSRKLLYKTSFLFLVAGIL